MEKRRLIDANALWELMRNYDDYQGAKEAHDLELIHRDSILFAIETAPTVDTVPVVRCKECKYAEKHSEKCYVCRSRTWKPMIRKPDFYCADGERKEKGDERLTGK